MSMEFHVHLNVISDDIIPAIIDELNKFEMACEVHPDFLFSTQSGFLPFKFRLSEPRLAILKDKDLMTGFELYIEDFDPEEADWFSPEDLTRLKQFHKTVTIRFSAFDSFQLRFADLTSAVQNLPAGLVHLTRMSSTTPRRLLTMHGRASRTGKIRSPTPIGVTMNLMVGN